jgi:hypothetical protein
MNLFKCFKPDNIFDLNNYTGAGCIFTDDRLILAGYHPSKKIPYISGIGGGKQENETYIITALRELIEELFNSYNISDKILNDLITIVPIKIQYTNNYVNCIYNFNQLNDILEILDYHQFSSELYNRFPINYNDLIFNRKITNGEISHLCLLPVINNNIIIDTNFNNDIKILYNNIP